MEEDNSIINDNDFSMIENLANMESRITVLENQVNDLTVEKESEKDVLTKDCILFRGEKYLCLKFIRKQPCIIQNKIRKIGFDICFEEDSICQWALKIET